MLTKNNKKDYKFSSDLPINKIRKKNKNKEVLAILLGFYSEMKPNIDYLLAHPEQLKRLDAFKIKENIQSILNLIDKIKSNKIN